MQKVQKKRDFSRVYQLTNMEKKIYLAICKFGIIKLEKLSELFCLSKTTISKHLAGIFSKFQVHSKAELIFDFYKNEVNNDR